MSSRRRLRPGRPPGLPRAATSTRSRRAEHRRRHRPPHADDQRRGRAGRRHDVRITDARGLRRSAITGLAAGAITFKAAPTGTFADGVTIWTGSGADTIHIDATHERAGVRTVTSLNTGLGNDDVTVDLEAGEDGFFVLDTQGGFEHVPRRRRRRRRLGRASTASRSTPARWVDHGGTVGLLGRAAAAARSSPSRRAARSSAPTAWRTSGLLGAGFDLKAGDVVTATVNGDRRDGPGDRCRQRHASRSPGADGALAILTVSRRRRRPSRRRSAAERRRRHRPRRDARRCR